MSPSNSRENDSSLGPTDRLIAASIGGTITSIALCPFDVIKSRLQAQSPNPLKGQTLSPREFSGSVDALVKMVRYEGPQSLWRGLTPSLIMAVPATALYFTLYETLLVSLNPSRDPTRQVAAAAVSGLVARSLAVTVTAPVELVRTAVQAGGPADHRSLWRTTASVFGQRGLRGFWRGWGLTLWRDVPFSMIYWPLYETFSAVLGGPLFLRDLLSGAGAGMIAAALTTPFDVLKTRVQLAAVRTGEETSKNLASSLRTLLVEEGVAGLFRGGVPRTLRVAPACAIMISSYQLSKRYLAAFGS